MSNTSTSSSGIGVLFVALKLTGFIDWSWWWVTAPFGVVLQLFLRFGLLLFLVQD